MQQRGFAPLTLSPSLMTCSMKCFCSFSLQKLMQSCSKRFRSKISKPKMSRMPINFFIAFDSGTFMDSLTIDMMVSKR